MQEQQNNGKSINVFLIISHCHVSPQHEHSHEALPKPIHRVGLGKFDIKRKKEVMSMSRTEIHKAASIITLMRQGNKPRPERVMDRSQKERIDDKWYHYQLKQIDKGETISPVSGNNWFGAR
ncbi:hypothetical protein [Aliivibrio salmonicida]|uniref:hypothetical protein n=1 Tax=Aliivibrio salmonicida TaxID=40269 RepID=UPI003D1391A6